MPGCRNPGLKIWWAAMRSRTPRIIRALLQGMKGPFRNIVLLNAAAALLVAGKAKSLREGVALAEAAIDSGKAKGVLDALVELSHAKV